MLFTKRYPSEYWSLNNWAILWPRLRGKNEVQVKFENSMHNYNVILVHWHHTLGCQCSSFGSQAVHKMEPVKQPKSYWRTDGQTDGNRQSNSRVGLHATRLKIDTFGILQLQTITNFTWLYCARMISLTTIGIYRSNSSWNRLFTNSNKYIY